MPSKQEVLDEKFHNFLIMLENNCENKDVINEYRKMKSDEMRNFVLDTVIPINDNALRVSLMDEKLILNENGKQKCLLYLDCFVELIKSL